MFGHFLTLRFCKVCFGMDKQQNAPILFTTTPLDFARSKLPSDIVHSFSIGVCETCRCWVVFDEKAHLCTLAIGKRHDRLVKMVCFRCASKEDVVFIATIEDEELRKSVKKGLSEMN